MMIEIAGLFDVAGVARLRTIIDAGVWIDGNATSGPQAALAKRNEQLSAGCPAAREAGDLVLEALGRTPLFVAASLPAKVFPPLFNRYAAGQAFGTHIDNAVRMMRGTDLRLRSDISATLFLADPDEYDGGELIVEDSYGTQSVKLPAGHMIVYPASNLHRVAPVTRGTRVASFFWIQSMVRDGEARRHLFELDQAVQTLAAEKGNDDRTVIQLTGLYHNLLRRWAEV